MADRPQALQTLLQQLAALRNQDQVDLTGPGEATGGWEQQSTLHTSPDPWSLLLQQQLMLQQQSMVISHLRAQLLVQQVGLRR